MKTKYVKPEIMVDHLELSELIMQSKTASETYTDGKSEHGGDLSGETGSDEDLGDGGGVDAAKVNPIKWDYGWQD